MFCCVGAVTIHDDNRGSYYCRLGGQYKYLGATEADAVRRLGGLLVHGSAVPATLAIACAAFVALVPAKSRRWREDLLASFVEHIGETTLRDVGRDVLHDYAAALSAAGAAPQTIRHKVGVARRAMRYFRRRGWCGPVRRPPALPAVPRRPRDLPPADLESLRGIAGPAGQILRFIAATGCRPGEAVGLDWSDVDSRRGVVSLVRHKTAATTGAARSIYLTAEALRVLAAVGERRGGRVFLNRRGEPYTVSGLRAILRRHLPGCTTYQLRHTFAQAVLDQSGIEDVAKLLGHTDLRMAQVYAQVRDDRARDVASRLIIPGLSRPTLTAADAG